MNAKLKAKNARRSRNQIVNRQYQNGKSGIILFLQEVVGLADVIGVKLVVMHFPVAIIRFTDLAIKLFFDLVKGFQFFTVIGLE